MIKLTRLIRNSGEDMKHESAFFNPEKFVMIYDRHGGGSHLVFDDFDAEEILETPDQIAQAIWLWHRSLRMEIVPSNQTRPGQVAINSEIFEDSDNGQTANS
jgi:hypothetical protein